MFDLNLWGQTMTFKRFFSLSVLATTCVFTFSQVSAQSLQRDSGPAEQPPASFTGNQYVDSKGCVYIRAGVDGNTSWVPRVSRNRQVVCGAAPSLPRGTAVASAPAAAPAPVQIGAAAGVAAGASATAPKSPAATTAIRPARTTVADVLAPRPVRTVASTPAPRPKANAPAIARVNIPQPSGVQLPQRRMAQPKVIQPRQQQVRTVQPAQRVVRQSANTASRCNGASGVSSQYIGRNGLPVRCGPQTTAHVTYVTPSGQVLDPSRVSANATIVPRHVYQQQQAARITQPVPQGYRQAWQDDRLNPRRAHMTPAGRAQSALVWTQDVPRRLIVASTGRDVTRSFPGLRYPYTSLEQQHASGAVQQNTVISSKSQPVQRAVQQQARVSTRSAAPKKPAAAAEKRFVQVGTFGVAANAQSTAQRVQSMGIPVRIGKFNRGGKEMRIVLAGPFKSGAHTGGALNALRNAGYRDAFARN